MKKAVFFSIHFMVFYFLLLSATIGQIEREPFEFQFENKTLRGLIEKPSNQVSNGIIIIIPGYGETNFVEGNWYLELRENLVSNGLTVCLWDKMGCGKSEGVFDAQQPVENSADEAIAAIAALKRQNIQGHEKIGLWGLSRGGWICPLINQKYPINFWISVSGTDDKENYGYLLKSNLIIQGKPEAEAEQLYQAWLEGHRVICTQGNYKDYLSAIEPLMKDSLCQQLFGYTAEQEITDAARESYKALQKTYTSKGYFDEASGLWVYIEDFDKVLLKIECPVLAIFGENDSQVDWRKTKQLYENTIGENADAHLTIKTFEQCNHSLQKCVSCAFLEDLSSLRWQACEGYYETIKEWLIEQQIVKE
jgi:esterase/lipase